MKKIIVLSSVVLLVCVSTCCTFLGYFNSDTETMINADGKVILKDTQVQWEMFTAVMDGEIQRELAGNRPPGGHSTWNERWLGSIKSLRLANRENYQNYINYIISTRRKKGLLDLQGL